VPDETASPCSPRAQPRIQDADKADRKDAEKFNEKDVDDIDRQEWIVVDNPDDETKPSPEDETDMGCGRSISSQFKLDLGRGTSRHTVFSWEMKIRRVHDHGDSST
jgi:hypothetical protein